MTDFLEKEQGARFFEIGDTPPILTDTKVENLKDYYSLALDAPSEQMEQALRSGQEGLLAADATSKANVIRREKGNSAFEKILVEQPEATEEDLEVVRSRFNYERFVSPDFAAVLTESTDLSDKEIKYLDRMAAVERIVAERADEAESGFWAGVGYFGDMAVSSVAHNLLGAPQDVIGGGETFESGVELTRLAEEAALLMVADISPEEFTAQFSAIIDRVADAGVFTETNPFYIGAFLEMVNEAGSGFQSDLEVMFQFLDVASLGSSAAARSAIRGVAKSGSRAKTISQFADEEVGKNIVVRSGDALEDGPILAEGTGPAMISPNRESPGYYSAPELQARRELESNNAMLQAFKEFDFGPYVSPDIIAAKKAGWLEETRELTKAHKSRELDYSIHVDGSGNIFGQAWLGKAKGGIYGTQEGAQKFADQVGGEVVRQMHEGKEGWIVLKEYNIPTEGLVDPTEIKALSSSFFARIMSTTAKTDPKWDAILKQGEAKTSLVLRDLGTKFKKVRKGTKWNERENVDAILTELRDDVNFNHRTEPYTPREFEKRYEELNGVAPRPEVTEYYNTIVELNDIDYYINADKILKEAVNAGEQMMELGGSFRRVRKVTNWDEIQNEKVWDNHTNSLIEVRDLDPEKAVLREVDGLYEVPGTGYVRFVVDQGAKTRRLYHSDVLPYNTGGHRKYNTPYLYFLKQESKIKLAGGTEAAANPKTFMGVRFAAEGQKAVDQINVVLQAIRRGDNVADINRVILSNNAWNTSVENLDDFKRVFDDLGLDLETEVTLVPDGEAIPGSFAGKGNAGQSFRNGLNAGKRRADRPLMGYGGNELDTLSPTKAIERGFAQTVARRGEMNYLFNAIEGWLAAAKKANAITNLDQIAGMSPRQALEEVKLTKLPVGRALDTERQTIKQRLSNTTAMVSAERNFLHAVASWVYGFKNGKQAAKALDWASTKDPAGFLRAMAFHTKLGLFNIDQLFVQANQIVNVIGITSATLGPMGAVRGALGVAPMRLALISSIPEGALKFIAKTQAPFTGISADDFIQLRDWIKGTGRNIIDRTVVEENNPVAFVGSSVLDWGQVFFKEGELAARLAAATTNFLERKAAGYTDDIFDPAVTRSMLRRQDVLTASMTSSSAAPWQRSLLAVPLQFTTYHVRMMEQLFVKGILSGKERIGLGLTHLMVYGTAAAPGIGALQDSLGFKEKVDVQDPKFDLIRYGALDAILTGLSGEETALSTRLAVGEGLWDLMTEFANEPLTTLAAGPGGTITYDSLTALASFLNNVVGGNFHQSSYDWNRFARNVSSYNKAYIFYVGRRYGEMVSRKTEGITLDEMSSVETVLATMGITLREQDALWTAVTNVQAEKEAFETHVKELKRLDNIASRELRKPRSEVDFEFVGKIFEDIGAGLAILRPSEKTKALSRLRQDSNLPRSLIDNLRKTGHLEIGEKLEGYISNE